MNKEKAQVIADKYGIRKVYTDYKELAADPEIDAVAIVTPDLHMRTLPAQWLMPVKTF